MDSRKIAAIVAPVMLAAGLLGASAVAAPNSVATATHSYGVGTANASPDPDYSRAPTPQTPTAEPPETPQVSRPAVTQENPCPPAADEQKQSPTCKMKGGVDARLKDCPPASTAPPSQQEQPDKANESADRPPRSGSSAD
ncbi:hypothetical protein [Streptomyces sp. NPDC023327]